MLVAYQESIFGECMDIQDTKKASVKAMQRAFQSVVQPNFWLMRAGGLSPALMPTKTRYFLLITGFYIFFLFFGGGALPPAFFIARPYVQAMVVHRLLTIARLHSLGENGLRDTQVGIFISTPRRR